jgi:hypothetical protein
MLAGGDGVIEARRIRKGAVTALICAVATAVICIANLLAARQHNARITAPYAVPPWAVRSPTPPRKIEPPPASALPRSRAAQPINADNGTANLPAPSKPARSAFANGGGQMSPPPAPLSVKAPGHPLEPRRVIGKCQVQMFGDVSFGYMSYCFYSVQCRDSTPVCLTCSEAWSLPALEVPLLHTSRPPLPVQSDARVWLLTAPMP